MKYFSPELVALSDNLMLNEYLYYYYYREQAIAAIVEGGETRGEQIAAINRQMLSALGELDIPVSWSMPSLSTSAITCSAKIPICSASPARQGENA